MKRGNSFLDIISKNFRVFDVSSYTDFPKQVLIAFLQPVLSFPIDIIVSKEALFKLQLIHRYLIWINEIHNTLCHLNPSKNRKQLLLILKMKHFFRKFYEKIVLEVAYPFVVNVNDVKAFFFRL